MTSPQIARTNDGWMIRQGDNKTQVRDTNRNGIIDDGDVAEILSGKAFAKEQLQSVSQSLSAPPQNYQQNQNPAPKKSQNIFGKIFGGIGNFFSGFARGLTGIFGGGFGTDAWSRNINGGVGFNDMQVGLYSMQPAFLQNDTMSIAGMMGGGSDSLFGGMNLGAMMGGMDRMMATNQAAADAIMADSKQRGIDQAYENADGILEKYKENPESINEKNLSKFEDGVNRAAQNNKVFSIDDQNTIIKITNAPLVNEELIQNEAKEKNKMPLITANKISNLITKYNAEADEEKKEKILKKEDYDKLTAILAKDSLDADDLKTVNDVVK